MTSNEPNEPNERRQPTTPTAHRVEAELGEAMQAALFMLNATVTEPGRSWYAQRPITDLGTGHTGKLAQVTFELLTDNAARDAGLLD